MEVHVCQKFGPRYQIAHFSCAINARFLGNHEYPRLPQKTPLKGVATDVHINLWGRIVFFLIKNETHHLTVYIPNANRDKLCELSKAVTQRKPVPCKTWLDKSA